MSMPGRHVNAQVRGLISRSIRYSLAGSLRVRRITPRLLSQAFCRTDYIVGARDPYAMDDNRHTESKSPELTEGDVPKLLLFADSDVIKRVRTQAASSAEPAARRDVKG